MKNPTLLALIFFLIPTKTLSMEKPTPKRTISSPASYQLISIAQIKNLLTKERFSSLEDIAKNHPLDFQQALKDYLKNELNKLNCRKLHIERILQNFENILKKDIYFLKLLIKKACDKNDFDLALKIFKSLSFNNNLLRILLENFAKEDHPLELFVGFLAEYHDKIEARQSPITGILLDTSSPHVKAMMSEFPTYIEEYKLTFFQNALSTYYMKMVTRLSKYLRIPIPTENLEQCFIHAAQQNCIDFFHLPQIQCSSFPSTCIQKALKEAAQHNQSDAIKTIVTLYTPSLFMLFKAFKQAAKFNQKHSALELLNKIENRVPSPSIDEDSTQEIIKTLSESLNLALQNYNYELVFAILESNLQLDLAILTTLIEKETGFIKKELLKKAASFLPKSRRSQIEKIIGLIE